MGQDEIRVHQYKNHNGKVLRYGFTTGSCAAAAARAAGKMLLENSLVAEIDMITSKGAELKLAVSDPIFNPDCASCSIIKDAGDDPDVTHGTKIFAKVTRRQSNRAADLPEPDQFTVFLSNSGAISLSIEGGLGIGRVTKPGLSVPVGLSAINPVPRRMIADNFFRLFDEQVSSERVQNAAQIRQHFDIEISAPEGEVLAKRTYNPHLGIVGGISIIGTTGIVEPMSEQAITETIHLEIAQKASEGAKLLILSPGNYGRDFVQSFGLDGLPIIKISNYIGESLIGCRLKNVKTILLIGHIGKLCKVAGGIFNTHSSVADGRMEILSSTYMQFDFNEAVFKAIVASNTTDEAVLHIKEWGNMAYFQFLANRISEKCRLKTYDEVVVGTILFSTETGLLGMCDVAKGLLKELGHE